MTSARAAIGVDLGGTKTEVVALAADGAVLWRQRLPTPAGDYPATLATIAALVGRAERELGVTGCSVGVGTPGTSGPDGRMRNANSQCLNGQPLARDLAALLQRPVRLANDANCLALSEATDGAGAGAELVFAVILGTGVGGGLVVHGRLLNGLHGLAGEWGHNPLPWAGRGERNGPACYCGQRGCIETWLSGPSLARDHVASLSARSARSDRAAAHAIRLRAAAVPPALRNGAGRPQAAAAQPQALPTPAPLPAPSGLPGLPGLPGPTPPAEAPIDAQTIVQRAAAGDPACEATLRRYEDRLARALAQVINLLDPPVIVLGGGLSNLQRLYDNVPPRWTRHVFGADREPVRTRLLRSLHGDSSGVRGAAWLWRDDPVQRGPG